MQVRFLLGPAGSGKTFRCLAEIRKELLRLPDGPPLILLAPKQATFQLERQLLADSGLKGYTRLHILSFERLAQYVLNESGVIAPNALTEEGRVMVLRALLLRHQTELKIFRAAARLAGFARELSLVLREFQQHQLPPERLDQLARRPDSTAQLRDKLHDLALLSRAYTGWLKEHDLQDAGHLLDAARDGLVARFKIKDPNLKIGNIWLDGFAEMTPQELDLLAALIPFCERATLAFCLPGEIPEDLPWLSGWATVAATCARVRERLENIDGCQLSVEPLVSLRGRGRFALNEALQTLESSWSPGEYLTHHAASRRSNAKAETRTTTPKSSIRHPASSIGLAVCSNPETEAVLAAREILQFVRKGGRYRDCGVIVRTLDQCHATVARVFRRYGIPFFMDRREPVAHHPLTELTRFALRTVTYGWRHDDWFGALKTGLVPADEHEIDALENAALEHGWEGRIWHEPLPVREDKPSHEHLEKVRRRLVPPFEKLSAAISAKPTGAQLAEAVRDLWQALKVEETLQQWGLEKSPIADRQSAIHLTVLEQMRSLLDNLELAFAGESLPLREWLPVLEAGLVNLTVGVIPPALDQVLVGAVDRSRNPDLKLALVLGLNEGIFPAPPAPGTLLTDADRSILEKQKVSLNPTPRERLGQERYLGYIACTRPSERLVLTCAARDDDGQPLNPSPFFDHVRQIAGIKPESFDGTESWWDSEHACELAAPVLHAAKAEAPKSLVSLAVLPAFAPLVRKWHQVQVAHKNTPLVPAIVGSIYGRELHTSVSALEEFGACPFKFFAARGLRLAERKEFQFDDRDKGSFQHEILQILHEYIHASERRWRDVPAPEMRELVGKIGHEMLSQYGGGRFNANAASRFTGELLIERLQQLMTVLLEWMPQYEFDPKEVEISFGMDPEDFPVWRLALPDGRALLLRGRIDRVDICRLDDDTALAVVMDYKSSVRSLNPTKLHHGLELQLLSYLGVLRHLSNPQEFLGFKQLVPAGVFYVPLNGGRGGFNVTRADALTADESARRAAYQHSGRFLADELAHFDNRNVGRGDQFKYAVNKGGSLSARGNEAVPCGEFDALREKVEGHLRGYARRILDGEIGVSPFRIGRETACERCDFRAVCRFDPWTQPYRQLAPPPKK